MKTIDLNNSDIHTLVDKEDGMYLGHVTTTMAKDVIYACYTTGHGRGQIILKKSQDGGKTWSARLPVPDNWSTSLQVPTIFTIWQDDINPRLILFSGHYPIRSSTSDNLGDTWSPLKPIGEFGGNVAMSSLLQLSDNKLIAFFHDTGRYLTKQSDVIYELRKLCHNGDECILFYRGLNNSESQLKLDPSSIKEGLQPYISQAQTIYRSTAGLKKDNCIYSIYKTESADYGLTWTYPEAIASRTDAFISEPGAFFSPSGNEIWAPLKIRVS